MSDFLFSPYIPSFILCLALDKAMSDKSKNFPGAVVPVAVHGQDPRVQCFQRGSSHWHAALCCSVHSVNICLLRYPRLQDCLQGVPGWQDFPAHSLAGGQREARESVGGGDAGCRAQDGGLGSGLESLRMGTQGCSQCCWDAARSREWCLNPELCCSLKHEERVSLGRKPHGCLRFNGERKHFPRICMANWAPPRAAS